MLHKKDIEAFAHINEALAALPTRAPPPRATVLSTPLAVLPSQPRHAPEDAPPLPEENAGLAFLRLAQGLMGGPYWPAPAPDVDDREAGGPGNDDQLLADARESPDDIVATVGGALADEDVGPGESQAFADAADADDRHGLEGHDGDGPEEDPVAEDESEPAADEPEPVSGVEEPAAGRWPTPLDFVPTPYGIISASPFWPRSHAPAEPAPEESDVQARAEETPTDPDAVPDADVGETAPEAALANLDGADLDGADLDGADLDGLDEASGEETLGEGTFEEEAVHAEAAQGEVVDADGVHGAGYSYDAEDAAPAPHRPETMLGALARLLFGRR